VSAPPLGTPAEGPDAPRWLWARVVRASAGKLALALYRTRFLGEENLPQGGYILAGNHVSYLDPTLLWCGTKRPTHFMAKDTLFSVPILAWGLRRFWVIPIKRGSADREAIQRATTLLERGEQVGMFPEGTRRKDLIGEGLGEAHEGVAFIALRAGVPVVPVGIAGTDKALPPGKKLPRFPRVTIRYGRPVCAEDYADLGRRERLSAMTAEIMRRIAEERELAEKA